MTGLSWRSVQGTQKRLLFDNSKTLQYFWHFELLIVAYPHGISADSTDRGQLRCKPFEAGSITWIWVAAFGETGDWFEVGDLDFCGIHFPYIYICHKFSMVVLADKRLLVLNCSFPSVLVMIIQIDLSLILVQFFGMIQRVDLRSL